jgi:hypothetical protein
MAHHRVAGGISPKHFFDGRKTQLPLFVPKQDLARSQAGLSGQVISRAAWAAT